MGFGDELMVTGDVRRLRASDPRKVRVLDRRGQPRWHDLWVGNPGIARPNERGKHQILRNGQGLRPYIDYERSTPQRWAYTDYRCTPGELFGIVPDARGAGRVLIEPNLKGNASPNKQWGRERWEALLRFPGVRWAQMCPPGAMALSGVERIETRGFREACAVLAASRGAVLPEGGLHHAAAALDRRVVVLFGAMVSPAHTGYPFHENIAVDDPQALGWRIPHPACERAWAHITPALVLDRLERTLAQSKPQSDVQLVGGVYLPAREKHLVDWMKKMNRVVDGRLTYQYHKLENALGYCKRFRRAIDVGAHCGLWSMHLVQKFAALEAFEPVALHRMCFEMNVGAGDWNLHPVALGETDGSVSMRSSPTSSGDTVVAGDGDIPMRRLDDMLPEADDVDFIKIDCEGYELHVLRGAVDLLQRCKPVICVEQKPGKAQGFGLGQIDAVEFLQGMGAKVVNVISGDYILSW